MTRHPLRRILILALLPLLPASVARTATAEPMAATTRPAELDRLFRQLADPDYRVREAASEALMRLGEPILEAAQAELRAAKDPEIRYRLRFVLDNISPPSQAILVVRAAPGVDLRPGDLITHVSGRRVRRAAALAVRDGDGPAGLLLRVRSRRGPRDVGPVDLNELVSLLDYQSPRGETIAEVLRLYDEGFAERAYELLKTIRDPIPERELSRRVHAILAYTAGDRQKALELLADDENARRATTGDQPFRLVNEWSSPSELDLAGPGKAPFHVELKLWERYGARGTQGQTNDPDLRVQRIFVPAGRYTDALGRAAHLWWNDYRSEAQSPDPSGVVAGNLLAVSSWMLFELDLQSECARLIEPRSNFLRRSGKGLNKWVRVQTDSWLPFLNGDQTGAIDISYPDALDIMQRGPDSMDQLIRNPRVAASIAFFLAQVPEDPRGQQMLATVNLPGHPGLPQYVEWTLFALKPANEEAVRRCLSTLLQNLTGDAAAGAARSLALLEYVRPAVDRGVLAAARERVSEAREKSDRDFGTALVGALEDLISGRPSEAIATLTPFRATCGAGALLHTAEFLRQQPGGAADVPALRRPILAIPLGLDGQTWVVLARDRRLLRFDAQTRAVTELARPSETWIPGPANWPWLGRDEQSGRVWVYDRRRVVELPQEADVAGVRLSLRSEEIAAFETSVAPVFAAVADALAAARPPAGETGEFLRREITANTEFVADPALPEVGDIRVVSDEPRLVQVSFRGGPHLLVDVAGRRTWSSAQFAERLGLERPPTFFARAAPGSGGAIVFLLSDEGLIRLDPRSDTVSRIALPGDAPYPALVPESCPYERRDPRWMYVARLPADGGAVYRVVLSDSATGVDGVEPVDLINEALPPEYFRVQSRAAIRANLSDALRSDGLPDLEALVNDAVQIVRPAAEGGAK